MRKILLTLLTLACLAAPAFAQLAEPDPNVGDMRAAPTVHRGGDPDQPESGYVNPWCAGCAAGAWWLCAGCAGGGAKGWQLGDWF